MADKEIEWPSAEAMAAYAWWDKPRQDAAFLAMVKDTMAEVYGPIIEQWRAEGKLEPRNDYHIFYEEWLGLESILPGVKTEMESPVGKPRADMPHEYAFDGRYGCEICGQRYHCYNCRMGSGMMGHYSNDKFTCQRANPKPVYGDE